MRWLSCLCLCAALLLLLWRAFLIGAATLSVTVVERVIPLSPVPLIVRVYVPVGVLLPMDTWSVHNVGALSLHEGGARRRRAELRSGRKC